MSAATALDFDEISCKGELLLLGDAGDLLIHLKRVLVVDVDAGARELLARSLSSQGFDVLQARSAQRAREIVRRHRPDIAIIDCALKGESGLELLVELKGDPRSIGIPILVLTAYADEDDKLRGFEAGADDYVTKPFSMPELMARVRAILRRFYRNEPSGLLRANDLVVNAVSQRVTSHEREIELSPLEFKLLSFLMAHPDKVLTRSSILNRVWSPTPTLPDIRKIDAHVSNLRNSLKAYECDRYIQTVYGIGYRFSTQISH
jgi:two-component system, OmpR family, phosphate regulon response regulator PhoB